MAKPINNFLFNTNYSDALLEPDIPIQGIYDLANIYKGNIERSTNTLDNFNKGIGNVEVHRKYNDNLNQWVNRTYDEVDALSKKYSNDYANPQFNRELNRLIATKQHDAELKNMVSSSQQAKLYEQNVLSNPDIQSFNDPNREVYDHWVNNVDPTAHFQYQNAFENTPPEVFFDKVAKGLTPNQSTAFKKYGQYGLITEQYKGLNANRLNQVFSSTKEQFNQSSEGLQLQRMVDAGMFPNKTYDQVYDEYLRSAIDKHSYSQSAQKVGVDPNTKTAIDVKFKEQQLALQRMNAMTARKNANKNKVSAASAKSVQKIMEKFNHKEDLTLEGTTYKTHQHTDDKLIAKEQVLFSDLDPNNTSTTYNIRDVKGGLVTLTHSDLNGKNFKHYPKDDWFFDNPVTEQSKSTFQVTGEVFVNDQGGLVNKGYLQTNDPTRVQALGYEIDFENDENDNYIPSVSHPDIEVYTQENEDGTTSYVYSIPTYTEAKRPMGKDWREFNQVMSHNISNWEDSYLPKKNVTQPVSNGDTSPSTQPYNVDSTNVQIQDKMRLIIDKFGEGTTVDVDESKGEVTITTLNGSKTITLDQLLQAQ